MPLESTQERQGIGKLGFVNDFANGRYLNYLRQLTNNDTIAQRDVDDFINSPNCYIEYLDEEGNSVTPENAIVRRVKMPWKTTDHDQDIYGVFYRDPTRNDPNDVRFIGVQWVVAEDYNRFHPYVVNAGSWRKINDIREANGRRGRISQYCFEKTCPGGRYDAKYFNSAGYEQFRTSIGYEPVTEEKAVFIRYETSIRNSNGETIYGWFTKIGPNFEGIDWGTEDDFRLAIDAWNKIKPSFSMGRITFKSRDDCNHFLIQLKGDIIPEPWQYRDRTNESIVFPILKSYIENVLDRLYYEHDRMPNENKIIHNRDCTKVAFNTNLMHRFGKDLIIVGDAFEMANKQFVYNPKHLLVGDARYFQFGFDRNVVPQPPRFLNDVDSPIYKSDWDVDQAPERYEHIIRDRRERFPERFRTLSEHELGRKLTDAIDFAKAMAQRSYTYIVPMYYPKTHQTQFLMPIYLDGGWSRRPDFTLVLNPMDNNYYRPMTILGLDEAYQDARLVNKPGESWLNDVLEEQDYCEQELTE